MRPLLPGLALLLLAACATPYERCLAPATNQLRTVENLIARTEVDIARGFTMQRRDVLTYEFFPCRDDEYRGGLCRVPVVTQTAEPVAIDREVEAGKLATLRERRFELRAALPRLEASCRAQFPEG